MGKILLEPKHIKSQTKDINPNPHLEMLLLLKLAHKTATMHLVILDKDSPLNKGHCISHP
jgi:hypothetical protein